MSSFLCKCQKENYIQETEKVPLCKYKLKSLVDQWKLHLVRNTLKMLCSMAAGLVASNLFSLVGRISVKTLTLSKSVVLHHEGNRAYFSWNSAVKWVLTCFSTLVLKLVWLYSGHIQKLIWLKNDPSQPLFLPTTADGLVFLLRKFLKPTETLNLLLSFVSQNKGKKKTLHTRSFLHLSY